MVKEKKKSLLKEFPDKTGKSRTNKNIKKRETKLYNVPDSEGVRRALYWEINNASHRISAQQFSPVPSSCQVTCQVTCLEVFYLHPSSRDRSFKPQRRRKLLTGDIRCRLHRARKEYYQKKSQKRRRHRRRRRHTLMEANWIEILARDTKIIGLGDKGRRE